MGVDPPDGARRSRRARSLRDVPPRNGADRSDSAAALRVVPDVKTLRLTASGELLIEHGAIDGGKNEVPGIDDARVEDAGVASACVADAAVRDPSIGGAAVRRSGVARARVKGAAVIARVATAVNRSGIRWTSIFTGAAAADSTRSATRAAANPSIADDTRTAVAEVSRRTIAMEVAGDSTAARSETGHCPRRADPCKCAHNPPGSKCTRSASSSGARWHCSPRRVAVAHRSSPWRRR